MTDEMRAWAAAECSSVDVDRETATFRDYEFSRAYSDWSAAWRNWMRKAQAIANERLSRAAAQPTLVTHEQREARDLAQLKDRRKAIGLAEFRDPHPNESAVEYRAAQDAEWQRRKDSVASVSSVAGSALRRMA